MPIRLTLLAVVAGACLAGCSTGPDQTCTPGQSAECFCSGGVRGAQICEEDGERFSVCDCGGTDGGTADGGADGGTIDGGGTDGGGDGGGVFCTFDGDCEPPRPVCSAGICEAGAADGGTDGGGNNCPAVPSDCDPNKYSDLDLGVYNTSNYFNLLLDTTGNGIPDTPTSRSGAVVSVDAWAEDTAIQYWMLSEVDNNGFLVDTFPGGNVFLNRVYIVVDSGGTKLGRLIITEAPDGNYSPLFQAFLVTVPTGYVPDTLKSEASITSSAADATTGIRVSGTNQVFVIQIVDASVTLSAGTSTRPPELKDAWLNGFTVSGYAVPGGNADGTLPNGSNSFDPDNVPPDPYLSDLWTFKQATSTLCGGANVYLDVFGGTGYSSVPILHPYLVPNGSCATIPTNANDVITEIAIGTYTPNQNRSAIVIVAPQH